MESQLRRSEYRTSHELKGKGKDDTSKMTKPPGFHNKSSTALDPYSSLSVFSSGDSSAFSGNVPDVGSFFGTSSTTSYLMNSDFDSLFDDATPEVALSTSIAAPRGNEVKHSAFSAAKLQGLFLPYLPQDDAVAAGLGEKDGGIDASEAQEVVDYLNQQLAFLLRCPPPEFWQKVTMDESLDTFIDNYLHFRRRWYDSTAFITSSKQTAGVIVGDGDLSRRVFMLLYRISTHQEPGLPSRQCLSAKEHAGLLKDFKLLSLPKLLDICAVYEHDNHELTSRLVCNVFRAQPSFASELAAMVAPVLERIDAVYNRCHIMMLIVEYLNDVIITLDSFIRSYSPAAFTLITAGTTSERIGMFLPALSAIYEYMLPVLSNLIQKLSSVEAVEAACQNQVKRLKSRIVKFTWKILETCFLETEDEEIAKFGDFPSLGGTAEPIKAIFDPIAKGELLVQAAIVMTQTLEESHLEKALASFVSNKSGTHMGALLRVMEKRHGLCEVVHERCQSGSLLLDGTQYEYLLSLVSGRQAPRVSNQNERLKKQDNVQEEEAVMLQSKISQVKEIFPEFGDGFVAVCLEAYDNDPERVISCILEDKIHPDLASLDRTLPTKPSRKVESSKDKGKGKLLEEPRVESKGKGVIGYDASGSSARVSSRTLDGSATSSEREGTPSRRPSFSAAATEDLSKAQAANANQGRFIRRGKQDGTFNQFIDSREKDASISATLRAAKQYEYEDEYDDSFDDLAGTYSADIDKEEETENLVDKSKRYSASGNAVGEVLDRKSDGKTIFTKGGLHQPTSDQTSDRRQIRQHEASKSRGPAVLHMPDPISSANTSRTGHQLSGRGDLQSTSNRKSTSIAPESNSSGWVAPSDESLSKIAVNPADGGKVPPSQGTSASARGGKSQRGKGRGKGKADPTANFYLKDGKLYTYKVAGAEASYATVEEYEASRMEEEETMFGLGAGGNVPAVIADERESSGNVGAQIPGGRGSSTRGRGGPPGRGRYSSKSNDNHRRKDQSMKKHFAGLSGL
uniref:CUE domain-containing protein n=1 Tax=Physcomitrium patens TaxID=3218 RepID=A0A7I4FKD2_PHYPA